MIVGLFLKYDREIGKWSKNREIPDLWGRVDRYVDVLSCTRALAKREYLVIIRDKFCIKHML